MNVSASALPIRTRIGERPREHIPTRKLMRLTSPPEWSCGDTAEEFNPEEFTPPR
jgi:hypothetical protein